ncbi:MmcQ/YjbR family DNA-binding protein [Phenylobacterium sp.]|uniref:MmcQ/YjbR family DNA-binding protein n=1 Tax=Phenylobacterium sp. TaxID=1871053 RepID=UPI002F410F97
MALGLPGVEDRSSEARLALEVRGGRGLVWTYLKRQSPKKPRVPQPDAVAVRCELTRKEMLVTAAPDRFFDDDHHRGYPAVLVRLPAIEEEEFAALLREAWRLAAPKALLEDASSRTR